MGIFATGGCRWRGWQFLAMILAAAWALVMGQLHLQVVVGAAPSVFQLPSVAPGLSPLLQNLAPGLPPLPSTETINATIRDQVNKLSNSVISSVEQGAGYCLLFLNIDTNLVGKLIESVFENFKLPYSAQVLDEGHHMFLANWSSRDASLVYQQSPNSSDPNNTFDTSDSSRMLSVLQQCETDIGPDFPLRMCGQSEIELYFRSLMWLLSAGIPPNTNCNSSNWPSACNPGWAGASASNMNFPGVNQTSLPANVSIPSLIPVRVSNPKSCCAGFFCPGGLTCMIPCPLGAYCQLAEYDSRSSNCLPYGYPGSPKGINKCGGADLWLAYMDSSALFCGPGKYCSDTITQTDCQKGHYCRTGSTAQTKCGFLASCSKDGLHSGDIKTQGILIAVLLSVSLLVIYTCSDQLMHIRERRKSKTRDIAARQAKERVSAVERWKNAREAPKGARKKVVRSLSKTMSMVTCKPDSKSPKELEIESQPLPRNPEDPENPMSMREWEVDEGSRKREHKFHQHQHGSSADMGSSQADWSNDRSFEEGPRDADLYDNVQLSPVYTGSLYKEEEFSAGKDVEVPGAKKTLAHTSIQIYKYAYGQIEKEKASQKSKPSVSSFQQVVESDGFREMQLAGQRRLQIELSFIDLCLVLKGSGKKILSNVTGKLSPSRVTAVMGPSGAGKTTFLNAVSGKETVSVITGQIFINGVPGSIQAYKPIIGFVPQDDIVHGNLTVEENLTFSAKYRLPVDTPRQERVLVVERTINRLGLAPIRNSMVGTVENRGISGGQRKRVNLGLELVIEPSLLILDEPTSGLDSTSSRLVVQSLRQEAALGVNVALVVHQPSYELFRMFDDVMFLAKGGYTVYMGTTTEIEAYFSYLGFEVPDRINPPDYFMDLVEGVIVPENDPSFDLKSLPILWMCHNGYHIPLELQETADGRKLTRDSSVTISYDAPKSFFRELWDELRIYVLVRLDVLETAFSRVKNVSGRQTPGFFAQYFLILKRVTKQRFRESRLVAQDYIILLLAGICLGFVADWDDTSIVEKAYTFTLIILALLVMIGSLRTFGSDKLQYWRESSSGINRLAFFLAKDTVDHFHTLLKPAVYLSMFYFYNNPRSSFSENYVITLALVNCCTGIAYVVSIILKPQPGQLFCVFLPVVSTLIVSEPRTGILNSIGQASYAFWANQAYTISMAERYTGVWLLQRCAILGKFGYGIMNFNRCIAILMMYGVGARILAFICLVLAHRKRQK